MTLPSVPSRKSSSCSMVRWWARGGRHVATMERSADVAVIGCYEVVEVYLCRKVPHRKWRAHGSGEPPTRAAEWETEFRVNTSLQNSKPTRRVGDGEGRLAARAATLPTTRRSPRAPTRFSSRDLKVPLAGRQLRVGFPSGICEAPTGKSQPSQWERCRLPLGSHQGGRRLCSRE